MALGGIFELGVFLFIGVPKNMSTAFLETRCPRHDNGLVNGVTTDRSTARQRRGNGMATAFF